MNQKICLVTGASSGIGKEIAIGLAASGSHVIIVCRNAKKGRITLEEIKIKSGSQSIDLLIADLSSQVDIQSLAKIIINRYPVLHVLINNAGLALSKKMVSEDGIEMTLATNYLGPFLLTRLLLDLLKQSAPARIINVSSAIHKWAKIDLNDLQFANKNYQFMKAYAQSKLLLNIASFDLAKQLEGTGVTVNCVHPGAVKTSLGANPEHNLGIKLIEKAIKLFFITSEQAAKPIIELALSPKFANTTGTYFVKGNPRKESASSHDPLLAKKVLAITETLLTSSSP